LVHVFCAPADDGDLERGLGKQAHQVVGQHGYVQTRFGRQEILQTKAFGGEVVCQLRDAVLTVSSTAIAAPNLLCRRPRSVTRAAKRYCSIHRSSANNDSVLPLTLTVSRLPICLIWSPKNGHHEARYFARDPITRIPWSVALIGKRPQIPVLK